MAKKKIIPIDYTSRDFDSIRNDLLTYVKRYYPDTYKDFNEASFGSLMLDTVSYVGDMLSFYLDYQANESFLETSIEYDNIVKHARQMGYKFSGTPMTYGECTFYILIPAATGTVTPDQKYIPTLLRGTQVATPSDIVFTLNENVNFADSNNEMVVARTDSNGAPTYFAIRASGQVVSGDLMMEEIEIGNFQRFQRAELAGNNISEIVSVIDSMGNEYFEVDYLSQDIIYKEIVNRGSHRDSVPSIMKAFPVPRRFVVEAQRGTTYLQFGYGSDAELTSNSVVEPSSVTLKVHGKDYVTSTSFDPKNLTSTDKFGIAPSNTTLIVIYRKNTNANTNVSSGVLTKVTNVDLYFPERSTLDSGIVQFISSNIECTNEDPIVGHVTMPTTEEIKRRAINVFATQNRAVTKQDYVSSVYAMPSRFGAVKRCAVYRDSNELKRNLNLYVISEGSSGQLTATNSSIKENMKTWLNEVRMIGDTIDILDAKIVNIGIEFEAIAQDGSDKSTVLSEAMDVLAKELTKLHRDIGEPFYVTDVYSILKGVDGLLDVVDVRLTSKSGTSYSEYAIAIRENLSQDGRYLHIPFDSILEIKFPYSDITGAIR